jgi:hypothetical protein
MERRGHRERDRVTAYGPRHVVPRDPEPGPLARFFRRAIAAVRRKEAAPEVQTPAPGAAATARFDCCGHCLTGSPCDPRDNHLAPCSEGCNAVLGNQMLSQVRKQWNAWHDDDVHARPHPATEPAGLPVLTPAQLAAHADAMHAASERYLPPPPRPVNGRSLPDQPRQTPVPWQELNRKFENGRPTLALLRQVAAGLRKVDTSRVPVYGEKPQLEVDKLYRNGWQ